MHRNRTARHPLSLLFMEKLTNILNFPQNLVPLGVLYFYNPPRLNLDLDAPDGWKWLTLPYNYNLTYFSINDDSNVSPDSNLNPNANDTANGKAKTLSNILIDLRYLIERCHVRVTYKQFPLLLLLLLLLLCNSSDSIIVARIYSIPADCDGTSIIKSHRQRYKRGKGDQWHAGKYKRIMGDLLKVLDYSDKSWEIESLAGVFTNDNDHGKHRKDILLFPCMQEWQPFSSKLINNGPYFTIKISTDMSDHVQRLICHESITSNTQHDLATASNNKGTIESKLLQIYDAIDILEANKSRLLHVSQSDYELNELAAEVFDDAIPGLKSSLYRYQKESVCEMLAKEITPSENLMPNIVSFSIVRKIQSLVHDDNDTTSRSNHVNIINKNMYLDLRDLTFKQSPEHYGPVRGGILAENMGLGKTCICLALISLTKHQISTIPSMLYPTSSSFTSTKGEPHNKSLAMLCADAVKKNSIPWKKYLEYLPNSCTKLLQANPASFQIPQSLFTNRRQSARLSFAQTAHPGDTNHHHHHHNYQQPQTRKLYLCSTTLIVVPNNLYYQWISEIKKHCIDGHLLVLYVPHHNKSVNANYKFPSALELIKYDVVLMGTSSFITEFDNANFSNNGDNIADGGDVGISPLRSVYWKRFIIDEGHSMSSKITRLAQMVGELHAERKWLVSGTPTSGMTELYVTEEVDNQSVTTSAANQKGTKQTKNKKKIKSKKNDDQIASLQENNNGDTGLEGEKQEYVIKRKFNAKDDLAKLGLIISNFFKISPWTHDSSLFSKTITKPFIANAYGSTESVTNLLSQLVIRHAMTHVESDIKLPMLHHRPVFLEPSFHNKLSINLFVAVLAANAVTSERTDQDYMFHPANRGSLKRLITNLQRSTFHWVGFSISDIETLVKICQSALNKKREPQGGEQTNANQLYYYSIKDRVLLTKCIESANVALGNKLWRLNSSLHEMSYFVSGLPRVYSKNFCVDHFAKNPNSQNNDCIVSVYPYMQLNSIQNFFFKNRFVKDEQTLKERIRWHSKLFWKKYWKSQDKKIKKFVKDKHEGEAINADLILTISGGGKNDKNGQYRQSDANDYSNVTLTTARKRKRSSASSTTIGRDSSRTTTAGQQSIVDDKANHSHKNTSSGSISELFPFPGRASSDPSRSPSIAPVAPNTTSNTNFSNDTPRNAKIIGTLSAKLSYLAARLLDHHVTGTKSIIFYQFEDSAYYLVELLDLLGLNYILYSTSIPVQERNSKLVEFDQHGNNSTENGNIQGHGTGITLIMDLKLAAHGLTIISATRMYFISPVWKKTIEAQAIKRCHRIGQTREVVVETLILKGTLEEEMYRIRMHGNENKKDNKGNSSDGAIDDNHNGDKEANKEMKKDEEEDIAGDVYDDHGMKQYFESHAFLDLNDSSINNNSSGRRFEYSGFQAPAINQQQRLMVDMSDAPESNFSMSNNHNKIDFEARRIERYIEELESSSYGLLKPVGILEKEAAKKKGGGGINSNGRYVRKWDVPLFTQTALQKINELQLKTKTFIKEEQVINQSFAGIDDNDADNDNEEEDEGKWKGGNLKKLKNVVRNQNPRKKLRFA